MLLIDLFIGKIYTTLQASSAVVGVAVAAAVMTGITSPSAVKYVEGGLIIFCGIMGASGAWGSRLLAKAIENLRVENENYSRNNEEHERLNAELSGKLASLEENNSAFMKSNNMLESQVKKLQAVVHMSEESKTFLENQIKQLMSSLSENGDKFIDFNTILSENIDKSATTAEMMNILLNKLGSVQFSVIDKNGDGAISKDEMMMFVENTSHTK